QAARKQEPLPVQPKEAQANESSASRITLWRNPSTRDAHLAAVNPEHKKVTRLTEDPDEGVPTFPIAWSPDGRSVAYTKLEVEGDNAHLKVYVRPVDEPKKAGRSLGVNGYASCWSPDGRHVVIVSDEEGTLEHHLVDVQTKKAKAISLPKGEAPEDAR